MSLVSLVALSPDGRLPGAVGDVIYLGLTIVVFALLFLLVRGVERIER